MRQIQLSLIGFLAFLLIGCGEQNEPVSAITSETREDVVTGVVTVQINGGQDDTISVEIADVSTGATVESIMRQIEDPPVHINGSGTTAFIDQIGDKKTVGSDGWVFRVDGEYSNEGVGMKTVDPPCTISWEFGDFRDLTP